MPKEKYDRFVIICINLIRFQLLVEGDVDIDDADVDNGNRLYVGEY